MPIYTVAVARKDTPNSFQTRGLNGMGPLRPEEVPIYPVRGTLHLFLVMAMVTIQDWAWGFINRATIKVHKEFRNIAKALPVVEGLIRPPTMFVAFRGGRLADVEEMVGLGFQGTGDNSKTFLGVPTLENVRKVITLTGNTIQAVPAGNVDAAGMVAYHYALKFANLLMFLTQMRKRDAGVVLDGGDAANYKETVTGQYRGDEESEGMQVEGGEDVETEFITLQSGTRSYYPVEDNTGLATRITSPDQVEDFGIFFPYFRNMMVPSKEFTMNLFLSWFSQCLTDSAQELKTSELISTLRAGFRTLSTTNAGMEIAHLYLGLKYGVECGAGVKAVVIRGVYQGFMLIGEDVKVIVRNQIHYADDPEILKEEVRALDRHQNALEDIATILTTAAKKDGSFETVLVDNLRSPRIINKALVERDLGSIAAASKIQLDKALEDLVYDQKFWEVTVENLALVMASIEAGDWILPDAPMYPARWILQSEDIYVRALSVFGPVAPTFKWGKEKIVVGVSADKDRNLDKRPDGQWNVPMLGCRLVPVKQAAVQWSQLRGDRTLTYQAPPKVAPPGAFMDKRGTIVFKERASMERLYQCIRQFCNSGAVQAKIRANDKAKGKRRQEPDDEAEAGPSTKKVSFVDLW